MLHRLKDLLRALRIALQERRAQGCAALRLPQNALIIAPHPDDETLGCGGLIHRLCRAGMAPQVLILSQGEKSHANCCGISAEELAAARRRMAEDILAQLGLPAENLHFLAFPDGGIISSSPDSPEGQQMKALLERLRPSLALIPNAHEGWPDHLAPRQLLRALAPQLPLMEYCVWSWYYNHLRYPWKQGRLLRLNAEETAAKQQAVEEYVSRTAPCGKAYSGVLPPLLLRCARRPYELYFEEEKS